MRYTSPTTWPLIGRSADLALIGELRRGRRACGVVIQGTAGVGKSRLAREALGAAAQDGDLTEWVQATSSAATVPLAAFASLLSHEVDSDDPLTIMRRSADALRARAGRRRLVLGVDDVQLLDPTSAALVQHLAASGAAFVVVTARTGQPCPDAITSLWKDSGVERLALDVLGEDDTIRLVESALGGPASQAALDWLVTTSAGNALFLSELLRGALENGAIERRDGLWRLVAPDAAVSASLKHLILERTRSLSERQREVLEILALAEPLPLDELLTLSAPDVVGSLEEQAMIELRSSRGQVTAGSGHPLYSEVVRASMPVIRGRILRVRVAQAFRSRKALTPGEALRVVTWLLEADEAPPAELVLDAARAALAAGDPEAGERLAAVAIEHGAGAEATIELARSHVARRRFDAAEALLAPLEGELPDAGTSLTYLELRASYLFWERKDPDAVTALLLRACAWHDEPAWRRRLQSLELRFAAIGGRRLDVAGATETLLTHPATDADLQRRVAPAHALHLFLEGHALEARSLARSAWPSVPLSDQAERVGFATYVLVAIETGGGHEQLDGEISRALVASVRAEDHVAAGLAALGLAFLGQLAGRLGDARRWLAEAELHFELGDTFGAAVIARAVATWVACADGRSDDAALALRRCEAALGGADPLPIQQPYVARARAWARAAAGRPDEARELLLAAASDADDRPVYATVLAYEAVRAGTRPRDVEERIRRAATRLDGPLSRACAADVQARAAGDAAGTLVAAERLEAAGALAYAGEAALAAAALFRDQGRHDSARRALARARALHARGQGGAEPRLDGLDGPAIGLTTRQEQLVTLAAEGLSNAEIAERLVLSIRTVESHIYRAMQKLGVDDRRQLSSHLPRRPAR
ncbi:LuxR C-terminal-related transcriptional regulator [Conexibacter sp. CPCC 206217]|uniref:LuxR C-terminal-related transcriptional regulator n=1 Tax=Conexibacter sp. CPCC 206217 TaxID=3064574 RepID=UPI002728D3AD|nr:LuxR family transcriptional regulator [Conexibacter sp. CPCC 206217]MDO8208868.1 LuxR C-terminal-related transcriptional regulator [Conexibacter sp. CPCC 206217]